ncbi:Oidioi.mRNA.OKI2018_I69.chr2.g7999.t1.cds [Oikopleura dioica]|uniref:Oidioi.mRNA.OKI2018_I69.chr2.g7999.t1.cds n=1 Tax=Oikopleura dioica TaxID=34765 RepID=A0ABN7T8H2_OIKDI|nr:Oidioi.mRNA.OKI2018_I69.chr2.g7999.t1.cds [Oikopleura dioica]
MFRNRVTQIIRAASSKPEKIFSSQLSKLSKGEKLTQELQVLQFDEKRDLFRRNRKKRVQTRDLENQYDLLQNLERTGIIRNHWPLHEAKKINQWVNNHARKIVVVFDVSKAFTMRDAVSVTALLLAGELGHKPLILLDDRKIRNRKAHRSAVESILRPVARIYKNFLLSSWFPKSKYYNFPEITFRLASNSKDDFKNVKKLTNELVSDETAEAAAVISNLNLSDGAYVFLIDDRNTTFTQEAFEVAEIMNEFSPKKALRSNIWFELDSSLFNDFTEDYLLNEEVQPYGVKDFIWKRLYKEDKEGCKKILRKLTVANEDQIKRHIMNVQGLVRYPNTDNNDYLLKNSFISNFNNYQTILRGETRRELGIKLSKNKLLHQVTDEILRSLLGAEEVEHARLTHLALEGDFSAISVLDDDQIALITAKVDTYDWKKQADYSFREFLIESGLMSSNEIDAEEKLWRSVKSSRPRINGIPISDADQIFIWDWMILPNNLSFVNFKANAAVSSDQMHRKLAFASLVGAILAQENVPLSGVSIDAYASDEYCQNNWGNCGSCWTCTYSADSNGVVGGADCFNEDGGDAMSVDQVRLRKQYCINGTDSSVYEGNINEFGVMECDGTDEEYISYCSVYNRMRRSSNYWLFTITRSVVAVKRSNEDKLPLVQPGVGYPVYSFWNAKSVCRGDDCNDRTINQKNSDLEEYEPGTGGGDIDGSGGGDIDDLGTNTCFVCADCWETTLVDPITCPKDYPYCHITVTGTWDATTGISRNCSNQDLGTLRSDTLTDQSERNICEPGNVPCNAFNMPFNYIEDLPIPSRQDFSRPLGENEKKFMCGGLEDNCISCYTCVDSSDPFNSCTTMPEYNQPEPPTFLRVVYDSDAGVFLQNVCTLTVLRSVSGEGLPEVMIKRNVVQVKVDQDVPAYINDETVSIIGCSGNYCNGNLRDRPNTDTQCFRCQANSTSDPTNPCITGDLDAYEDPAVRCASGLCKTVTYGEIIRRDCATQEDFWTGSIIRRCQCDFW